MNSPLDNPQRWLATVVPIDGDLPPFDVLVTLARDESATLAEIASGAGDWEATVDVERPDRFKARGPTVDSVLGSVVRRDKLPGLVIRWRREGEPSDETLRTTIIALHEALVIAEQYTPKATDCGESACIHCARNLATRTTIESALKLVEVTA